MKGPAATIPPPGRHPASVGMKKLMTVLHVMDDHCGDELSDDDWNAIFSAEDNGNEENGGWSFVGEGGGEILRCEATAILRVGMRNRRRLAERVSRSLDVEITRVWAFVDRASNAASSSVHFHPADVIDDDDNPATMTRTGGVVRDDDADDEDDDDGMYGAKNYNRLVTMEERICHARIATLLIVSCYSLFRRLPRKQTFIAFAGTPIGDARTARCGACFSSRFLCRRCLFAYRYCLWLIVARIAKSSPHPLPPYPLLVHFEHPAAILAIINFLCLFGLVMYA